MYIPTKPLYKGFGRNVLLRKTCSERSELDLHLPKKSQIKKPNTNKTIKKLTKKYFVNYEIGEYGFDKDTLSLTNSEILSINKVFD